MTDSFDRGFQAEPIEANAAMGLALSEIGRSAGLPPGASSCEIQARVIVLMKEVCDLTKEWRQAIQKVLELENELQQIKHG